MTLLEGDAEYVTALNGLGLVVCVDLDDVVTALTLGLEDGQSFVSVAGCDDAVGHLDCQQACGVCVALVGQGNPVAVRAQTVGTACTCVCACDG